MSNSVEQRIKNFFSRYTRIRYKKGESILRAEDTPQGIYFLKRGYVRMFMLTSEGTELTLNIFKPGNPFPLTWAMAEIPNEYFFESMTDSSVLRASVENFLEFIKKDEEILFELGRNLAFGIDNVLKRLQYLTLGNSHTRVTNVFLLLGKRLGEAKNGETLIKIPVTHQDIAKLSGLTRETVGHELKELKKSGLIIKRGRLYLLKDVEKLQEESTLNKVLAEKT